MEGSEDYFISITKTEETQTFLNYKVRKLYNARISKN